MTIWKCGRHELSLDRPLVMGIVNLTPDSFSDGGHVSGMVGVRSRMRQLLDEGADILDIGAESSRPGAAPVTVDEERRRLAPAFELLHELEVPVSIDTSKPEVMAEALAAGASAINDVRAFTMPGAVDALDDRCGLVVMHMAGEPDNMQDAPRYDDVVADVTSFLRARRDALVLSGVQLDRIVIDPGIGFGKTVEHNVALVKATGDLRAVAPVLVGLSRKGLIGALTGRSVDQRVVGSAVGAVAAAASGAAILRVHDVAPTVDALAVWRRLGPDLGISPGAAWNCPS